MSEPRPACLGYTGYLASLAATRSYEELIAGILPCFRNMMKNKLINLAAALGWAGARSTGTMCVLVDGSLRARIQQLDDRLRTADVRGGDK